MNVPEVALHPPARRMVQQQMRLPLLLAPCRHESADLIVSAQVAMLLAQTMINPRRRVPLLARG